MAEGADYAADEERAQDLRFLGAEYTHSLGEAAIRFALGSNLISTVLIGFSDLAQLEEAMYAERQGPLPDTAMSLLSDLWTAWSI